MYVQARAHANTHKCIGQIEHMHHVQGTSSVTLAIFTSEDAARAAYTAHLDNKGEAQVQHGTPLYLPEASEAVEIAKHTHTHIRTHMHMHTCIQINIYMCK